MGKNKFNHSYSRCSVDADTDRLCSHSTSNTHSEAEDWPLEGKHIKHSGSEADAGGDQDEGEGGKIKQHSTGEGNEKRSQEKRNEPTLKQKAEGQNEGESRDDFEGGVQHMSSANSTSRRMRGSHVSFTVGSTKIERCAFELGSHLISHINTSLAYQRELVQD